MAGQDNIDRGRSKRQDRSAELRVEDIALSELKSHPRNARTHSRKQIRQIADSFRRFGFNGVIVINAANMIIAGHGRVEAARLVGLDHVPCVRVTHLSEAEERAYALADNKITSNAGWDRSRLVIELMDLNSLLPTLDDPLAIGITGFETGEIDALMVDLIDDEAEPADNIAAPLDAESVTRKGDLWLLGPHRLICGDARNHEAYSAVMAGQLVDLVITDPPYNVRIDGHVSGRGKRKHQEFAFATGEMSDEDYRRFLMSFLQCNSDACRDGALIYVFMDWRHIEILCAAGRTSGLELVNICVWNKTTPGQGSFYRSAHELVAVFRKSGASSCNNIALGRFGRTRTNVWTYAPPNKFRRANDLLGDHPTPKPVAMVAEAIKDASPRSGIILDGFLGSGTTILAAEKVGRICFGIEYEPKYCDLAIRRWQEFSGRDAVLETSRQTYEDVKAERTAAEIGSAPHVAASTSENTSGRE